MTDKQNQRLEELEDFLKKNNLDGQTLSEKMLNHCSVFISGLPVQVDEKDEKDWIGMQLLDEALDIHVLDVISENQYKLSVEDVLIICAHVQEEKEYFIKHYDEINGYDEDDE